MSSCEQRWLWIWKASGWALALAMFALGWFSLQDAVSLQELTLTNRVPLDSPMFWDMVNARRPTLIIFCAALAGLYFLSVVSLARTATQSLLRVTLLALPAVGFALLTLPFDSTDYTVYINHGWLQSHYGLNPYVARVLDIPGSELDEMFRPHWTHLVTCYGPVFMLWMKTLAGLSQGSYPLALGLLKLGNGFAHVLMGLLLYMGSVRLRLPRPDVMLWAYWASPLLLVHHLACAHNDVWAALFVVLALFCLLMRRAEGLTLPFLMVASLIKFLPVVLVPAVFAWMLRVRVPRRVIRVGVALSLVVLLMCVLPYTDHWRDIDWHGMIEGASISFGSLYELLHLSENQLMWAYGLGKAFFVSTIAWSFGLFLFSFRGLERQLDGEDAIGGTVGFQTLVKACVCLLLLGIYVASSRQATWYVGMVAPLFFWLPMRGLQKGWLWRFGVGLMAVLPFSVMYFGVTTALLNFQMLLAAFFWASLSHRWFEPANDEAGYI